MERVNIYLRTSLFTYGGNGGHLPSGVMVIEGHILDRPSGAVSVRTATMRDARGRPISEAEINLQIPWAKIDHMVIASG